jgi:hypothetical protein
MHGRLPRRRPPTSPPPRATCCLFCKVPVPRLCDHVVTSRRRVDAPPSRPFLVSMTSVVFWRRRDCLHDVDQIVLACMPWEYGTNTSSLGCSPICALVPLCDTSQAYCTRCARDFGCRYPGTCEEFLGGTDHPSLRAETCDFYSCVTRSEILSLTGKQQTW